MDKFVVKIHPMKQKDVDSIERIEALVYGNHHWSKDSFYSELTNNLARYYCAFNQTDELIGYSGSWVILDEAHITNIAVLPEYRKKGVGEVLLTSIIDTCYKEMAKYLTLEVRISNKPAISLYEKYAFKSLGTRKGYYQNNNEDALKSFELKRKNYNNMIIEKSTRVKKENVFKYNGETVKLRLGTLILMCLCVMLIIIATFTQFSFTHYIIPVDFMSYIGDTSDTNVKQHFLKYYRYIPQIPVIVFVAALLGRIFGVIPVLVYISIGLFVYPVFALGGGIKYIFDYNFGYILAYIPAVFFSASILKSGFSIKNIIQASIVAVLTIHIIGILYTLFIGTIEQSSNAVLFGWIIAQSGTKILYDIIFSILSIITAGIIKRFLWITMC